jgi:hypothetical protein
MGTVSGELPKFGWFEMLARVSERFTFNSNCRKRFGRPTKACPNPPDLELCGARYHDRAFAVKRSQGGQSQRVRCA